MDNTHDYFDPLTVPVLIDDDGGEASMTEAPSSAIFPLVRCVYFAFDAPTPMPGWSLDVGNSTLPFFLLGVTGIIHAAIPDQNAPGGIFQNYGDIERTFNAIEQSGLLIETGRLYLPRPFIQSFLRDRSLERNDALRVRYDLFIDSLQYAQGRIGEIAFESLLNRYRSSIAPTKTPPPLEYSPLETKAFRLWCIEKVATAQLAERTWESRGELRSREDRSSKPF
jgi:hypothetical protein